MLLCRSRAAPGWQVFPLYTLPDCPPGHTVAKSGCFKVSTATSDKASGKSSTGWPVLNLPLTYRHRYQVFLLYSATVSGQEGADYRVIVCLSSIKTADVDEQKAQKTWVV